MKNLKVTKIAAAAGAALALGVVSQSAFAHANLLPAIKVGGGWVSVVSYVNTQPPAGGGVFVHATHQSKNMANLDDVCVHVDGRSTTTINDLTTTVLDTPGGTPGSVFPAADNVGGAIINPATLLDSHGVPLPTSEGFLVLENYDGKGNLGPDGTLTSDAIVFNLASGFLYSTRALSVTHQIASPGGLVTIDAPGCSGCNSLNGNAGPSYGNGSTGNLTRFTFLPPGAPALTGAYLIPTDTKGNLVTSGYGSIALGYASTMTFEARMDAAQGYAQGIYDRLEGARSLSVTNKVTCVGQLTPQQVTGNAVPNFIANGGWFNLSGLNNPTGGPDESDSALTFKVEWAPKYGLSIQPLNQQWYAK
jgi:hypothetical protein